jgi:hypothetical protein
LDIYLYPCTENNHGNILDNLSEKTLRIERRKRMTKQEQERLEELEKRISWLEEEWKSMIKQQRRGQERK